jgi:hypothetical protein
MAWTFLGVVYLELGHTHLANRAFKEAQAQEPGYLRGWAGQALVAEVSGVLWGDTHLANTAFKEAQKSGV